MECAACMEGFVLENAGRSGLGTLFVLVERTGKAVKAMKFAVVQRKIPEILSRTWQRERTSNSGNHSIASGSEQA